MLYAFFNPLVIVKVADDPTAQEKPEEHTILVAIIVIKELVTVPEQATEQVGSNELIFPTTSKNGLGI